MAFKVSGNTVVNNSRQVTNIESYSGNGIATQDEAETGTNNDQLMTPLRVKQAIEAIMRSTKPETTGEYFIYNENTLSGTNTNSTGQCFIDRKGTRWISAVYSTSTTRSIAGRGGSYVALSSVGSPVYLTVGGGRLCGIAQNPDTGTFIWAGQRQVMKAVDPIPGVTDFSYLVTGAGSFGYHNFYDAHYGGNNTFICLYYEAGKYYKSTDDGATMSQHTVAGHTGLYESVSGWNNRWLLCTNNDVYYSSNNTSSWSSVASASSLRTVSGISNDNPYSVHVVRKTGTLLIGSERGIYRSTNNGSSWSFAAKLTSATTQIMNIKEAPNGALFALARSGEERLFRSVDDGATWTLIVADVPAGFGSVSAGLATGPNNEVLMTMSSSGAVRFGFSDATVTAGEAVNSFDSY